MKNHTGLLLAVLNASKYDIPQMCLAEMLCLSACPITHYIYETWFHSTMDAESVISQLKQLFSLRV